MTVVNFTRLSDFQSLGDLFCLLAFWFVLNIEILLDAIQSLESRCYSVKRQRRDVLKNKIPKDTLNAVRRWGFLHTHTHCQSIIISICCSIVIDFCFSIFFFLFFVIV